MGKLISRGVMIAAFVVTGLSAQSRPQDVDLQAAIKVETVTGDLDAAIKRYRVIVDTYSSTDRATAATALLRMAGCYRKMGGSEADRIYEQIVREYADERGPADRARTALAESQAAVPARARSINAIIKVPNWNQVAEYSPDGRFAVVGLQAGSPERGEPGVGLVDLDSGVMRVLAPRLAGNEVGSLQFSPDGKHVVATVRTGPRSPAYDQNYVVLPVQSEATPITVPGIGGTADDWSRIFQKQVWNRPAWSPNGTSLAHLSRTSTPRVFDIRVLNTSTGEDRSLGLTVSGPPDFRWSPTGAELAFRTLDAAASREEIHIVTLASGVTRSMPLPASPNPLTRLVLWTTNGQIVTRRKTQSAGAEALGGRLEIDDTMLIDMRTGTATKTCTGRPALGLGAQKNNGTFSYGLPWAPEDRLTDVCLDVTPDGASQIVWRHASRHLWVVDTATLAERPLTLGSGEEQFGFMSADGKLEAFISNRDARWGVYVAPITSAPVPQPLLVDPLESLPNIAGLEWTRTGLLALYDLWNPNVYRVHMDPATGHSTGVLERLTEDAAENAYPAIAPNSDAIAYLTLTGGRVGLSVMTGDGSDERRVLDDPQPALTAPLWRSNDELMFAAHGPGALLSGPLRLVSLNLRTHETRDAGVVPALEGSRGAWHWDYVRATNELVYYTDPVIHGSVSIHARSLPDGADRVIATIDAASGILSAIRVSPDGRRLAFLIDPTTAGGPSKPCELGVINLDSPEQRSVAQVNQPQALVAWSPDSRFLLYGGTRPRIMDVTTGQSWLLIDPRTQSVPDDVDLTSFGDDQGGSWAPDGSYVALHLYSGRTGRQLVSGVTLESVMKLLRR